MTGERTFGWHVRRGAAVGAAVGAALALLMLANERAQIAAGVHPAGAGLALGIHAWLASVPAGLVLSYVGALLLESLGVGESPARNTALILAGVVANLTAFGALVGAVRGGRRQRPAPPAT